MGPPPPPENDGSPEKQQPAMASLEEAWNRTADINDPVLVFRFFVMDLLRPVVVDGR